MLRSPGRSGVPARRARSARPSAGIPYRWWRRAIAWSGPPARSRGSPEGSRPSPICWRSSPGDSASPINTRSPIAPPAARQFCHTAKPWPVARRRVSVPCRRRSGTAGARSPLPDRASAEAMRADEASRLRARAVTLEALFRREAGDADVQVSAGRAARIAVAEGAVLPDRGIELDGVDAVAAS